MLVLSRNVALPLSEVEFVAIRAQGSGGQNVNKVSSAVQLRFDVRRSSLPDFYKERLLALRDQRLTKDGVIVIKSQEYRTQGQNKQAALERLFTLIKGATKVEKARRETKPSKRSQVKRMDKKTQHGKKKQLRGRVDY